MPAKGNIVSSNFYRHSLPALDLSIERNTEQAPSDGQFHVIRAGELLGSFRSLKMAQKLFRTIVQESGYQPAPPESGKTMSEMMTERYLESKDLYWSDSHKYRGGGGRGGRGGI